MSDERLLIDVKVEGGSDAVRLLNQVGAVVSQITKDSDKLSSKLNKAMSSLSKEIRVLSAAVDLNKKYEISQQKIQQEINKTIISQQKQEQAIWKTIEAENKAVASQEKQEQAIWKTIEAEMKAETASSRLTKQINATNNSTNKATDIFKRFGLAIQVALGNAAVMAINNLGIKLKELVGDISTAGVALDGITNTFAAGARGWKQGGEEMQFVADMANRLGLNLKSTYEPYAKFMTSFTRSGGTLAESRQIFEDLSVAMVSLHLPATKMEAVFVALEQMANKGTVQAEELKRQLANALPGAFELAAESMGILPSQLMDLMKKGQVVSKDFLPKFAATVKDALGKQIGVAVDQYNANLNRLQSQTWLLQANLGQAWNAALTPIVKFGASSLKYINDISGGFFKGAGGATFFQTSALLLAGTLAKVAISSTACQGALAILNTEIKLTAISMQTLQTIGIVAVFTAIASAAFYCANQVINVQKKFDEMRVQTLDVTNNLTGLLNEYTSLSAVTNKSAAQQEAWNRVLGSLKQDYPTVLEYIETNKIDLDNLNSSQAEYIANLAITQKMQDLEKEKMEELSNGWLKFGSVAKSVGRGVVLIVQSIGWVVTQTVTTVVQAITKTIGFANQILSGVVKLGANVVGKMGFKELSAELNSVAVNTKNVSDGFYDVGKAWRSGANQMIKDQWASIFTTESERQIQVNKKYKDSIASLGVEQAKLAKSFQQTQAAREGLTGSGGSKGGKGGKSTKTSADDVQKKVIKNINEEADAWKKLEKAMKEVNQVYEHRVANSLQYTDAQIEEARQTAKSYNAIVKYAEVQKQSNDILQITSRTARDLTTSLVDGLFEPLKEGESIWTRFKDAGKSALKSIATEFVKNKINLILAGFQGGWSMGNIGGGTLGQKAVMGLIGAGQGFIGQPLLGTKNNQAFGNNSYIASAYQGFLGQVGGFNNATSQMNGFAQLNTGATQLANTLSNATTPAISTATNTVMGVANPALNAANSIASMAISAPIAATSMGALGTVMTISSKAFITAAPALTAMATAMATLATSASTAATAMAALAVSTAAESVAKIPFVGGFLAPVAATLTGAAIAAGTAMTGAGIGAGATIAGGGQMLGGAMSGIGNKLSGVGSASKIIPHAKGGIVSSPTMFPMQGGNIGLAGEAGSEVIAPARRMSNGDLGVGAVQPKVTVNNYANAAVEVIKRPNNEMEIKITELNAMLSSSRSNKGMYAAQSRLSTKGRQIG